MRNQHQNTASFYNPFGMSMMGYSNAEFAYSYGMNTQEKDDEIYGEGNSYSAEYWQYDARLGRRWNVDPVVKAYESPYSAFGNNPIWFVDLNGADTSVSVTTSQTQDVYASTTHSHTFDNESIDESDDRFQNIVSQNRDLNPVPNSPNVKYSNLRIQTVTTVTNHTTTTVTYNADGTTTEETIMTSTITTSKRILFDVTNDMDGRSTLYPVKASYSFGLSTSTTDPKSKSIETPTYMKTFVNAGIFERSNSNAGNIRTLNSISGYEGDIEYHSRVVGYTAGSGIIITGIGKKAKNPYVIGVTQIVGGTLIIIGQVAETGMNSYVWLHNTYSIPYNKKNWIYRAGAIVPNTNR